MRAYIIMVAAAAVLSAFCDILIPKGWQKYIGILTGAVLLTVLISPVITLRGGKMPEIVLPEQDYIEYDVDSEVKEELKKRVEEDIAERLMSEFGVSCRAQAEITAQDGKITGVGEITLDCAANERISARLKEIYGCERVVFG